MIHFKEHAIFWSLLALFVYIGDMSWWAAGFTVLMAIMWYEVGSDDD